MLHQQQQAAAAALSANANVVQPATNPNLLMALALQQQQQAQLASLVAVSQASATGSQLGVADGSTSQLTRKRKAHGAGIGGEDAVNGSSQCKQPAPCYSVDSDGDKRERTMGTNQSPNPAASSSAAALPCMSSVAGSLSLPGTAAGLFALQHAQQQFLLASSNQGAATIGVPFPCFIKSTARKSFCSRFVCLFD